MSVHGAQRIIQFIQAGANVPLKSHEELYSALHLITGKRKQKETLQKVAKALWSVVFIQGLPSTHIAVDEIGISQLSFQISNPPRQAEIGHLLRHPQLQPEEKLNKILDNVRFKDAAKSASAEEQETQIKVIPGLFSPEFLQGLKSLLPSALMEDVGETSMLDSAFSTDKVIDLSEQFRKLYELIRGNELRWNSVKDLLTEPFNRWETDLVVQLKETKERFDAALNRRDSEIDEHFLNARVKSEKDTVDMWIQREKKRLCVELVDNFRPLVELMENAESSMKKLYVNDATIALGVDGTISAVEDCIKQLDAAIPQCYEKVKNIHAQFDEFLKEMQNVDNSAIEKVHSTESELTQRLQQKNVSMEEITAEKMKAIDQIAKIKGAIDQKFQAIKNVIEGKIAICKREAQDLARWAIPDEETKISMPIIRVFIPVYVGLFETPDMDERLVVVLPQRLVKNSLGKPFEAIHPAFERFEGELEKLLNEDVKRRSNFEFACETKNIFADKKYKILILKAVTDFGKKNLSEVDQAFIKEFTEKAWKE